MRNAFRTIGLILVIAVASLAAMGLLFSRTGARVDANPNEILARTLLPHLRDGQTFDLAAIYPDPWDAVQVVHGGDELTNWEWRTLRAYDAQLLEIDEQAQLLIFWLDGGVARVVQFDTAAGYMPWFTQMDESRQSFIIARKNAVFRATLTQEDGASRYTCVPEPLAVPL